MTTEELQSMDKVRIGFVGTGTMGQAAHLVNYTRLKDDVEVVALAEARPGLGAAVGAKYGVPGVYTDADEMLASEWLDALVVPQQFTRQLQVVGPLYRHGLPILTEKPLALSTAVAGELVGMLENSPTPFHRVGFHKRSEPAVVRAKAIVDDLLATGRWGALRSARITMAGDDCSLGAFDDVLLTDEVLPAGDPDAPIDDAYVFVHQLLRAPDQPAAAPDGRHVHGRPRRPVRAPAGGLDGFRRIRPARDGTLG